MDTLQITISLPRSVLAATGVREGDLDRLVRELIAVELYRQGRISLGKATEVAGVSTKWEMIFALARHGVWIDYTADDASHDITTLKGLLYSENG